MPLALSLLGCSLQSLGETHKAWDFYPACSPIEPSLQSPGQPRVCHFLATGTRCQEPENSCMAAPGPHSLSAAFQKHLQLLGLRDFPCGLGSWVGAGGHGCGMEGPGGVCEVLTASPLPAEQVPLCHICRLLRAGGGEAAG